MNTKRTALNIVVVSLAGLFALNSSYAIGNVVSPDSQIDIQDPYADDPSNSPWAMSMENVTTYGGRVIKGGATLLEGTSNSLGTYTPYFPDRTTALSGYGSSQVGVGCDGINLGGVIDGQLAQYQQMVEGFIQNAPALAIMYLAYSQPTVKAVIDELNTVGQFGLDLTNMSCSGVRAIADKAAEEKAQAMAEARCTAEAGYKDPDCMSDDGLLTNISSVMRDTKKKVTDRSSQYLGKVSNATGGLVQFKAGIDGSNTSNGGTSVEGVNAPLGVREQACSNIPSEGLRTLILASSGISCESIELHSKLLPDYKINDSGESGVIPRSLTLKQYSNALSAKYMVWIQEVFSTKEPDYMSTDGFKAIYNRSGVSITKEQHRKIARLFEHGGANYSKALLTMQNLAQLAMLKDLTQEVDKINVAVYTGIQNQPDRELLSDHRRLQFINAAETLRIELNSIVSQAGLGQLSSANMDQ